MTKSRYWTWLDVIVKDITWNKVSVRNMILRNNFGVFWYGNIITLYLTEFFKRTFSFWITGLLSSPPRWRETKGSLWRLSVRNAYKNLNNFVFVASISIKLGGKSGFTKFHILPNVEVTSRSKVTGRCQSTFGANVKF